MSIDHINTTSHGDCTVYTWSHGDDLIKFTATRDGLTGVLLHRGEAIARGSWRSSDAEISVAILRESAEHLMKVGADEFSMCGWVRTNALFLLLCEANAAGRVETLTGPDAEALVERTIKVWDDPYHRSYRLTFALTADERVGIFEDSSTDPYEERTEPAVLRIFNDEQIFAMVNERIEAEEAWYRQRMDGLYALNRV